VEKVMRIAFCISGQPRTWKKCYQSWFDAFSHLGTIDTFYHIWDYNSHPNAALSLLKKPKLDNYPIILEEIEEIYDTLKPKNHQVQSEKVFSESKVQNPIAWWSKPQFYGIKKAAFLKREYEIENNFEYDLVCRIRTDLMLPSTVVIPSIIEPNTLYTCMNHHDPEYKIFRIADIFYCADSYTYDQMSNFYYALDYIDATHVVRNSLHYSPETAFYYFMKTMGIRNHSMFVDCKVARTEEYAKLKGHLDGYEVL
jgi:hypothetical protein